MNKMEDVVLSVIKNFIKNNVLFTALDVSNTVKNTLPFTRHREVRDVVRSLFISEIESAGYARTSIAVTLIDGTTTDALLYHPLSDSWDLDSKYDSQKRAQSSLIANNIAPNVTTVTQQPTTSTLSNKDVWDNLLQSQPSLFVNK